MRKLLLLSLMVGALPLFSLAKDGPAVPTRDKQSLHFVENKGQIHDQNNNPRNDIQFSIPGKNMSLFVGNGQLHYQFYKVNKAGFRPGKKAADVGKKATATEYSLYRMDVELVGANMNGSIVKEQPQEYTQRYYTISGNRSNSLRQEQAGIVAHSFNKIVYKDVYPNIDWVMYTKDNGVEYEFVVRPGGNPSDIKLKYNGATTLRIDENGGLNATTPMGSVSESAPYSYQEDGQKVNSSFKLEGEVLTFNVGAYTGTLVIDPTVAWGTYYGGSGDEEYNSVSHGAGNIYAIGNTNSINNIASSGAVFQPTLAGLDDMFISKFSTAGVLVWSTYYGGAGTDIGNGITYNANGNIYVVGSTDILGTNEVLFGAFVNDGTFFGDVLYGEDLLADDVGLGIRSSGGTVYVCGYTNSLTEMATPGALQTLNAGSYDGFLFKYDAINDLTEWSTYYGGPDLDILAAVGADASNNVYAAGTAASTTDIATLNTYGGGSYDGFVTKISPTAGWLWGRYFGGNNTEEGMDIDADASGNSYLTGYTLSPGLGAGGFQNTQGGNNDGYIAVLNTNGAVSWSSYFGGAGSEIIGAVNVNANGVFLGGSTTGTITPTTGGFQTTSGGGGLDAFMVRATTAGALTWASYYGGNGEDEINSITSDGSATYIVGITSSSNNILVNSTVQLNPGGGYDAFVARINECTPPAQPGTITGSASVCAGSSQTYTIAAVTGATSYTWTLPGGWTGTSTTASITTTVGSTGGTISVTANNTCGSSTAQTLAVTVNPIPTATITPAGTTTFCAGGSVVLNANTGTGYSWAWFQGATPVGTNSSSYTANATGNYTVQITANGCSATSTAVSVTVNPAPNVTASSNSAVCVGQALNLTGGSTTPGATYSWAGPAAYSSNTQSPSIPNAQAVNAGVYTLTVTANGCTATATTTVVVTNVAPAAPAAINGDITICANSTGNIYDVTADPNAASYNWTLPTGWSGTSTTNTITATAGAAGSVSISVTAQNGCGTSAATTLNVTVNPLPTVTITQSVNTLTATAGFASYQWYDGSGPIAGATSATFNATGNGSYYCIVTDANGCTAQSNTINVVVGVNNVVKQSSVSLFPNPNNGSFTLEGAFASNDGKASVVIVDIAGRIVHQQQVTVSNNKLDVRMDMNSSLAAGVYTIKVSSDAANTVIPFVKK